MKNKNEIEIYVYIEKIFENIQDMNSKISENKKEIEKINNKIKKKEQNQKIINYILFILIIILSIWIGLS